MQVRAGTSGFKYKGWRGPFYPEGLKDADMLRFYSQQLPVVEINNTFYRMPKPELTARWASQTEADFQFVIKASRIITHVKRLKDAAQPLHHLLDVLGGLGDKLGALLFQLPPNAKKNTDRLREFLGHIPPGRRAAFEFRHTSWFDDDVYQALSDAGGALCIADDVEAATPFVATADWGYLRLRRMDYGPEHLAAWADRVAAQSWERAYVFFKHEDAGAGPKLAAQFLRAWAAL